MISQPEQRARLQSVIGEVYATLGDYPRARAALDPAIATLKASPSADPVDLAHALDWVGYIAMVQGDLNGALDALNQSESLLDDSTPRRRDELATLHGRRAGVLYRQGNYSLARDEYRAALDLRDKVVPKNTLKAAGLRNNYGNLLRGMNDLKGAETEYEEAIAIYKGIYGVDSENVYLFIGAGMNLGMVLIDLGNFAEARTLLEKASAFFLGMDGHPNLGYANAEDKLGEIDRLEGKFDDALKHYDNSEHAYRTALGDHHHSVALPIQDRGQVELERGRYDAALLQFERALALRLETLPRSHREVATSLDGRSQALLHLDRYDEASKDAEEALAIWRKALPANHPLIVYSLLHVGLARFALGDTQGAQTVWSEALELAPGVLADNPARLDLMRRALTDPLQALANPVPAGSYDQ
jgi:tetratricopeptide (TPR) repeat protein